MGEETYDVTPELIAMGREAAVALTSDSTESDDLKDAAAAPAWVRHWPGPFRIEMPADGEIDHLFDVLSAANAGNITR